MADTVAHPPENGTPFVDGAAKDAEEPAHDNAVKADSKKGEEKVKVEEQVDEQVEEAAATVDAEAEPEVVKVEREVDNAVEEGKESVEDVEMAEPEQKDVVGEEEEEQEVAVAEEKAEEEEEKMTDAEVGEKKEGGEGEVNEAGEEEGTGISPAKRGPGRPKKAKTGEEKVKEEKSPRKMPRSRTPKKEKEAPQLPAFASDRPSRERKSIERFIASVDKGKNKEIHIKQGEGEALKDIPNVAYKLSKRTRNDEILSMLHSLLFHKRGKASVLKYHILQFSGYVWEENQEKERARVKEKLERYTKEGLISLVDVFDLHLSRTGKKEELVVKVLEFLEKPYKTTDVLLEEKEQRKSAGKRSSSGKRPGRPKKQKVDGDSSTKKGRRKSTEGSDADESGKGDEDDSLEEEEIEKKRLTFKDDSEEEDPESVEGEKSAKKSSKEFKQETEEKEEAKGDEEEEGMEEAPPSRKKAKVSAPDSPSKSSTKPVEKVYTKSPRKSSEKKNKTKERKEKENENDKDPKATPAKKGPGRPRKSDATPAKKDATSAKKSATPGKKSTPSAAKDKDSGKKSSVKESKPKKNKIPTDEEMQIQIRLLLKDADFSKVTFTDVVSQLEGKFGVTLVEQKSHVKKLIKEEISKLAEEGDDEGEAEAEAEAEAEVGAADNDKGEVKKEDEPEGVTTPGTGPNEDVEQPVEAVEGE